MPLARPRRVALLATTGLLLLLAAFELSILVPKVVGLGSAVGVDFHQYQEHARRWLAGGGFYLPHQLAGPYDIQGGDPLYPPPFLYLIVPFVALPELLWWLVPLGIGALVLWRLRPAAWSWPVLAALVAFPRTLEIVLFGNPTMWIAAFVAAGTLYAWPSALVLLKPTLLPFALVGMRDRRWWLGLAGLAAASVPLLPMFPDWIHAALDGRGWGAGLLYSLRDVPMVALPVVAWLARSPATLERATVDPGARSGT